MPLLSPLQMTDAARWKGLTTENHLGAIWQAMPQKASELITTIQQNYFGNNLDTVLAQYDTLYLDTDEDYTWELQSQGVDNIPLVETRINGVAITPADEPGINFSTFELVFDVDWFFPGERIVGEKNEHYPILIQKVEMDGTYSVCTCIMDSSDSTLFLPYEEAVAGKRFSSEYAPVERTLSRRGRKLRHKSHMTMRNSLSQIRIEKETPGNMKDRKMACLFQSPDGKVHKLWQQYESFMFDNAFREDINKLLMFGTTNRGEDGQYRVKGESGFEIKEGAGLRQQMESANTSYYNTFDIEDLSSMLLDLSEGKIPGDKREFVLRTGERGAFEFHKALERYTQLFTPLMNTDRMYTVGNSKIDFGLGYGGQFVEFRGPNNIKVNLSVDSMYDDRNRNKTYHPSGGVVESYRYDIMDIGTSGGEANIRRVEKKGGGMVHKYIPGMRHPFSPDGALSAVASKVDGWEEIKYYQGGVMLKDPSRTASMINSLQA